MIYQNSNFELVSTENDFQLVNKQSNLGVYINQTAALIWTMLKDSSKEEIVASLKEQFPENKKLIDQDVEDTISMLMYHGIIEERQ